MPRLFSYNINLFQKGYIYFPFNGSKQYLSIYYILKIFILFPKIEEKMIISKMKKNNEKYIFNRICRANEVWKKVPENVVKNQRIISKYYRFLAVPYSETAMDLNEIEF